tara:strand:- start:91 stop:312 length:222 start_codon:yes stop_codon:yes gene_type:complete
MPKYRLTKFEIVSVLGARATQIADGAPSTVDIKGLSCAMAIAKKELDERKIPMVIIRTYPENKVLEIPIKNFL